MMDTIRLVKTAFRKLKAHVYFDKTTLPLRDKVVAFESSSDFEKNLQALADAYDNASLSDSTLMSELLSSIDVLPFPKKVASSASADEKAKEKAVISIGNPKEKPIVEELQYFIDMDVRGHIIGIMWIIQFGLRIDERNIESARGNRLRKSLIWDEDGDPLDSPALFEPYFAQYSLWRDGGLSCAKELLDKNHDVMILTLDLKKFYYRTGITELAFKKILGADDDKEKENLHTAVFSIFKKYTDVLTDKKIDHNGIVLPIGFLPSAVLSNWCLDKFDKGILDYWNPSYYGRYVDDIIIVEKIEKGSEIYKLARDNALEKDFVIDFYLGNGRRKNTQVFASKASSIHSGKPETVDTTKINNDDLYRVDPSFCQSEEGLYEFQSTKTRIIALFADNNSTALINKFKREIYENVSEFRLMPEVGEAFSQDDFSEFYKLENDATVNKLRGVREILMDKYELSKFLGRYRVVSSLVEDGRLKRKFTSVIGKMFNDRELIENYILWERVFEIFITDKDYNGFKKFAKRVKDAISSLTIKNMKEKEPAVKESLHRHFISALNRTLSLVWGENAKKIIEAVFKEGLFVTLRHSYITTHMINKYVMSIPAEIILCPTENVDGRDINFTEFTEGFNHLCKEGAKYGDYEFLPYFRQAQDIAISMFLGTICDDSCDSCKESKCDKCEKNTILDIGEYIDQIKQAAFEAPVKDVKLSDISDDSRNNKIIQIGDAKSGKLKIAIANVSVSGVWNLENMLKTKKPNRKYTRYCQLSELVNTAIKEKGDVLVLPENYVPIEWLSALASKSAREGMAIITGVEHIIVGKIVYNYTAIILPFKYFNSIPTAAVFLQLKKYYSPDEKRIIEGYGFKPAQEDSVRPLYRWCDCYFPVYTCFELSAINDRAEFMSWADMVVAVEFNRDTNYFSSIVESLTRDLHCYCIQVNTSEYGDSRIAQPTKREEQNLLSVKGGLNQALLIGEIDILALREFQLKDYSLQKGGSFKPTPPGIDVKIVRGKLDGSFD